MLNKLTFDVVVYCNTSETVVLGHDASDGNVIIKVGMKLEAVDQRFPYFVCVATIMDRNGMESLNVNTFGTSIKCPD